MRAACAVFVLAIASHGAESGMIEGQLLNGDGTPWAGAQVTAYKLDGEEFWKRVAETDREGRFRLPDLPPGRYRVRQGPKPKAMPTGEPFGELVKGIIEEFAVIAMATDAPDAIEVRSGQTVRHDIRLPKRSPVRFVLKHRGTPLCGAEVRVFLVDAKNRPGQTLTVGDVATPRTDRMGVALLGEIDEGRYAVQFDVGQWSVYGGVHEVKGSEPHCFRVELGEYSVRLKILDAHEIPVPKALVTVSWGEWNWSFVRSKDMEEFPGEGGIYLVPYVSAGKINVWVNGPNVTIGSTHGVEVGPENPEPEVLVILDLASLTIRVVDAKGVPVAGVHVRIENAEEEKGVPTYSSVTNRRGEVLHAAKVRRWRIRIEDPDRGTGEWTTARPEIGEDKVVVLSLPEGR
ncbi:MAG: carboxypeptidase regulatory-like domain-containing protein [Planctomycetaceae bacterium]